MNTAPQPTYPTPTPQVPTPPPPTPDTDRSVAAARPGRFAALAQPGYRAFFIGATVSSVGTWMQRVAQTWLVLEVSGGSAAALGAVTALQFAPALIGAPVGGSLADRVDRRRLLVVLQGLSFLIGGLLAATVLTGSVSLPAVYVAAALFGAVSAVEGPVRGAFLHDVVPAALVANAVALNSLSFNAARVLGPALAGVTIAGVGVGWAIAANAASYLAVAASLAHIGRAGHSTVDGGRRRDAGSWRASAEFLRSRPDLVLVLTVAFAVSTLGMNFALTNALMVTEEFHRGPGALGMLSSVMAVGSLTGSFLASGRAEHRIRLVITSAVWFSLSLLASSVAPGYGWFAVTLAGTGLATVTVMTALTSYVQMAAAPALRGRVMAIYMLVLTSGVPFGAILTGVTADAFGARVAIAGTGVLCGSVVVLAASVFASRHQLRPVLVSRDSRWPVPALSVAPREIAAVR